MVTSTVPADSPGEVAVQLVVDEQITAEAEVVPKSIAVSPATVENPVPVIVTEVPPETGPEMGETPVTVGGEGVEEGGEERWGRRGRRGGGRGGGRRPLGVERGVRREGVDGAVGVGGAQAVGSGVPAREAVAGPGEGVGRQRRRGVVGLGGHRPGSAVGVEGDGVRGFSSTGRRAWRSS